MNGNVCAIFHGYLFSRNGCRRDEENEKVNHRRNHIDKILSRKSYYEIVHAVNETRNVLNINFSIF